MHSSSPAKSRGGRADNNSLIMRLLFPLGQDQAIPDMNTPETLVLIKIDNYFGSKWLGFSGKALGALRGLAQSLLSPPQTASGSHPSYRIGSYHNGGFPVQPMKKSIAVS